MQFIDLAEQQRRIKSSLDSHIAAVLAHGQYIMGPEVAMFEERLAEFVGVRHCVGVANGTDAIQIALMALGVGRGDEVITPSFSFIAAAEVIRLLGAEPVLVDVDPYTYNMSSEAVAAAITPRTRAIIPVDLFGQCADYQRINAIAARHGIPVIEDAAQSMGATVDGRRAGSLATIATTSFFPSKPLGGYGDGGACFTDDGELAKAMRSIRVHGQARRYEHVCIGINGRLDTLQAAILLAKLDVFEDELRLRHQVARRYDDLLSSLARQNNAVVLPYLRPGNTSAYAQYTIRVPHRRQVIEYLRDASIPTAVHYPLAIHKQPVFAEKDSRGWPCPESERASDEVLSLPMHPYLNPDDQELVADALETAFSKVSSL